MTEPDFDGESVLRFFMTNFDVEDEDNKVGKQTIFSPEGNGHKLLNIPVADATALSHLHDACRSVVTRQNPEAAMFVANFMRLSAYIVQHLSCKEQVQEIVLEAVMDVATRRDCFSLYTREIVLKAAMESAMFTNPQRERLMERLAKTWGEAIWSTENGIWNCPIGCFEQFAKGTGGINGATMTNDIGPHVSSYKQTTGNTAPDEDRMNLNLSADERLNIASGGTDEGSEEYSYSSYEEEEGTSDRGIWNSVKKENFSCLSNTGVTAGKPPTVCFMQYDSPSDSLI
ncbi:hypothetical protein HOLleu_16252 [Holothuria leucospilota]|uniref:Uncharacterized protein n=1 Tax=Holothuria leucospilota TaxID=206669 RepID=A0A9Q1H7P1_HOLLE|nr:hypothetical protein HOLleu_16252 [Holothuria leucospilota]